MIKLIAIDVDGTLLNSKAQIDKDTIDEIRRVKDKVKVVISTGRMYSAITEFIDILQLNGKDNYSIINTGSQVVDNNGQFVVDNYLSLKDYEKVKDLSKGFDVQIVFYTKDEMFTIGKPNPETKKDADYIKVPVSEFDGVDRHFGRIGFVGNRKEIDRFQEQFEETLKKDYYTMRNETFLFEILPKESDKQKGLEKLADILNIDKKEIMAIGDKPNDLNMIKWAGIGVSMGQSSDLIKENSDYVTDTNDNNGVAKAIKKFIE